MSKHSGKPQHKSYAETGKVEGIATPNPSKRFAEGGFIKHGDYVHATRGALNGYDKKVGKNKG